MDKSGARDDLDRDKCVVRADAVLRVDLAVGTGPSAAR